MFVDHFIATGDHIAAYSAAYPTATRRGSATKGRALLKKPAVAAAINKVHALKSQHLAEVRDGLLSEEEKNSVLSELELDLLLSRIARGDLRIAKVISGRGGQNVEVLVGPDISERIAAIDKLYKRYGSYTQDRPNPIQDSPYPNMSDEELRSELKKMDALLND